MYEKIMGRLKSHVYPFTHLSISALDIAARDLRVFHICRGERVVFPSISPDDFLFLITGNVLVDGDEKISIPEEAAGEPYRFSSRGGEVSIQAVDDAVLCRGNARILEDYLALDELGRSRDVEETVNPTEILLKLRGTEALRGLSVDNAYQALRRMTTVRVAKADEVVRQYEEGDAYYIIREGTAEVWREDLDDDEQRLVAVLGPGDGFGEESLVMEGSRNATVKMITDGELLKLSKEDFDELITTSMIETVKPAAASALARTGHEILDVRYEEEYQQSFIPGSILIPLPELRARMDELDKATTYLVLCKKGSRAAAATLLLRQRGIKAMVIEGGIIEWPCNADGSFVL
ncbi:cyclic nucleotide-binding domain-containing protein [Ovoidimarina sediminis]|uniref:cyclic nucleotide-binding domain-containing protein n=1 Tax=Ovoidimarina sediminis TaxID=3079856 RepID=UPI002907426E|nr:cyclic nucleotide-binding domain-containing protein [Rhodophyticola sp. MJ-SS7]MDU8946727.1 cyclic nucleotide-binding domain-containing protein [Rhodophyticola sp. MJ-SS7]